VIFNLELVGSQLTKVGHAIERLLVEWHRRPGTMPEAREAHPQQRLESTSAEIIECLVRAWLPFHNGFHSPSVRLGLIVDAAFDLGNLKPLAT
jgi:hypothetical protein